MTATYYSENKERSAEQSRRWRENNRERYNELQREWRRRNPQRAKNIQAKSRAKAARKDSGVPDEAKFSKRERLKALFLREFPPTFGR